MACRLDGGFKSQMRKRRFGKWTGTDAVVCGTSALGAELTGLCVYWMAYCLVEHRNKGGQILFIEFCDWAIKQKQLNSQGDGDMQGDGVGGDVAGHGAGPTARRAAALAKGKGGGSGGNTSDFRCWGRACEADRRVICCWIGLV